MSLKSEHSRDLTQHAGSFPLGVPFPGLQPFSAEMAFCEVTLSWQISSGELSTAVIYRREEDDEENGGSPKSLPSTGLVCIPPFDQGDSDSDNHASCTLSIRRRSPPYNVKVSALDILSDARHMEIYSDAGEYVDTCRGILVRELGDEHKLYLLQHTLDEPLPMCKVKLLSLHNPKELWLHSVHITVSQDLSASSLPVWGMSAPTFDVEKVQGLLKEMGREVPPEAQGLVQAIQTHQQNQRSTISSAGPLATMLANMSGGEPLGGGGVPNFASMMSMLGVVGLGSHSAAGNPTEKSDNENSASTSLATSDGGRGSDARLDGKAACEATENSDQERGHDVDIGRSSLDDASALPNSAEGDSMLRSEISGTSTNATTALEKRLVEHIQETEDRIMNSFSRQLQQLEEKLENKLDTLLDAVNSLATEKKLSTNS